MKSSHSHKHAKRLCTSSSRMPLGLPKGTVRSIITLSTVGMYFVAMFFQMFLTLPVPETMSSMVITVIAFYFGVRSSEDVQGRSRG